MSGGDFDVCNVLSVPEGRQLLYHYTKAAHALDHILPEKTLLMAPYATMRDPLEYHEIPRLLRYREEGDKPGRLPIADARDSLADLRARTRILSLTSDATGYDDNELRAFGKGYARPRMWEAYGDNNTGVCLAFDADEFVGPGGFRRSLEATGGTNLGSVGYTPGGFVRDEARVLPDVPDNSTAARRLYEHLMSHSEAFWFLKLCDWETEYEFRVVHLPANHQDGPIPVRFAGELKAVVLGAKFDQRRVAQVSALARRLGSRICQLDWSTGYPSVRDLG